MTSLEKAIKSIQDRIGSTLSFEAVLKKHLHRQVKSIIKIETTNRSIWRPDIHGQLEVSVTTSRRLLFLRRVKTFGFLVVYPYHSGAAATYECSHKSCHIEWGTALTTPSAADVNLNLNLKDIKDYDKVVLFCRTTAAA